MNILFICGSLKFGEGGVSDYTRFLAEQCLTHGHRCQIIAISDPNVDSPKNQQIGNVDALRLPRAMPWKDRVSIAKHYVDYNSPDWISLQFVSYIYHPKGLLWNHLEGFREIIGDTNLQVMFHETWIGVIQGESIKNRIIGNLQSRFIAKIFHALKPKITHTQCSGYISLLKQIGLDAKKLPLFGSIPVYNSGNSNGVFAEIAALENLIDLKNRSDYLVATMFGSIHALHWDPRKLFEQIHTVATQAKRKPIILSLGYPGAGLDSNPWTTCIEEYKDRLPFVVLGKQSAQRISEIFSASDIGIACTSWARIEKSGAATAMLEHGMPVILARTKQKFRDLDQNQFIEHQRMFRLEDIAQMPIEELLKRSTPNHLLETVTSQFLESLQSQ